VNRGNIRWMAPELLEQEIPRGDLTPYTEATDIYSFTMTTIEIYTGSCPFPHLRHNVEAALPGQGRPGRRSADGISHCIDDTLWDIIQECWVEDPARRLSARDAKERLEVHRKEKLSIAM
jgi:Protein tyrosine and serine/threonine kinase